MVCKIYSKYRILSCMGNLYQKTLLGEFVLWDCWSVLAFCIDESAANFGNNWIRNFEKTKFVFVFVLYIWVTELLCSVPARAVAFMSKFFADWHLLSFQFVDIIML